jgi:hypothetical protein
MFNSGIIDTAIGIVFIYLLLSLIASAVAEAVEAIMRNRASDLERGIRELITDRRSTGGVTSLVYKMSPWMSDKADATVGKLVATTGTKATNAVASARTEATDAMAQLYDHPLINGLFKGSYPEVLAYRNQNVIRRLVQWLWRSSPKLPTYIPAQNFALALLDIAVPANAENQSGATGTLADPKSYAQSTNPIRALRNAIVEENIIPPDSKLGRVLLTLIDAAGNDMNQARVNIETWFNNGMDRVSGWYKRRTQFIIFVIGLLVAIALNADTVLVVRKLSTDKELRDSVAAAAVEYAKANAAASPTPMPVGTPTVTPAPKPAPGEACWQAECKDAPDSPKCNLQKSRCELSSLGLPIGWNGTGDPFVTWPGWHWKQRGGWWWQIYWHGIGWLLTALAISLGAPFWFDLLNKFIVIRSTVKPKEKSPDEKSKD